MIAADTSETFEVIVAEDLGKPRDQQRRIVCRYMSMRESAAFQADYAKALDAKDDQSLIDLIRLCMLNHAKPSFEGPWRRESENVFPEMTLATAFEICEQIPTAQMLTEIERKKSARQSRSGGASSAAPAAG